mmetsp:Transcript_34778/g.68663  ORF Transcript_34778/g.68663 Transcript_34778/m.68663 type:complete len:342 (+) Transcript_34778:101-1126(+)
MHRLAEAHQPHCMSEVHSSQLVYISQERPEQEENSKFWHSPFRGPDFFPGTHVMSNTHHPQSSSSVHLLQPRYPPHFCRRLSRLLPPPSAPFAFCEMTFFFDSLSFKPFLAATAVSPPPSFPIPFSAVPWPSSVSVSSVLLLVEAGAGAEVGSELESPFLSTRTSSSLFISVCNAEKERSASSRVSSKISPFFPSFIGTLKLEGALPPFPLPFKETPIATGRERLQEERPPSPAATARTTEAPWCPEAPGRETQRHTAIKETVKIDVREEQKREGDWRPGKDGEKGLAPLGSLPSGSPFSSPSPPLLPRALSCSLCPFTVSSLDLSVGACTAPSRATSISD